MFRDPCHTNRVFTSINPEKQSSRSAWCRRFSGKLSDGRSQYTFCRVAENIFSGLANVEIQRHDLWGRSVKLTVGKTISVFRELINDRLTFLGGWISTWESLKGLHIYILTRENSRWKNLEKFWLLFTNAGK